MWKIEDPQIKDGLIDFTGEGIDKISVKQLFSDDIIIANCLPYPEPERGEPYQIIVCEKCGRTGCQDGNWVNIRYIKDHVLFIPAFKNIKEDEQLQSLYMPPQYIMQKGAVYFEVSKYLDLELDNYLVPIKKLKPLSSYEAACLYQLEAPHEILGKPTEPMKFNSDYIVACSDGDANKYIKIIKDILKNFLEQDSTVDLTPVKLDEQVISFYIDIPAFKYPEWKALVYSDGHYSLFFESSRLVARL